MEEGFCGAIETVHTPVQKFRHELCKGTEKKCMALQL